MAFNASAIAGMVGIDRGPARLQIPPELEGPDIGATLSRRFL
jgi:hypothetical protein